MLPDNLLIINYHKIEEKKDFGITTRHPKDFCDDLDCLVNNGYKSITFKNVLEGEKLTEKSVLITFDDSYHSFYTYAYKNLLKRNLKAVVYVPVNYIGKQNDWDVQFFGKTFFHMNEMELMEISKKGMEIGSHTLQHRYLNNMPPKILDLELGDSKSRLEEIINTPVYSISYPFGRFNKKVLQAAKKYYKFGVQQMHKVNNEQEFQNLTIQRINIYRGDTRKCFESKIKYHLYRNVRIKSKLLQAGSWATIFQQFLKRW